MFVLRFSAVCLILFFGVLGLIFIYNLTNPVSGREPVKLSQTQEYYHYYYGAASAKKIALTFDDGPTSKHTEEITAILKHYNVPATFFFVGQNVLANPDVARRVSKDGFTIGNHSFTHAFQVHESKQRLAFELNATSHVIEEVTGIQPTYYRPPFLLTIGVDPTVNPYEPISQTILWPLELGYVPVGADIDSKDWMAKDAGDIVMRTLTSAEKGHIALFHDEKHTVEALPAIIEALRSEGYTFVSLDDVLIPPTTIALPQDLRSGVTDAETGGAVSHVQWFLYTKGLLDPYALTGVYDEATKDAVGQYQIMAGIVDPTDLDPLLFGVAEERTRVAIALATERNLDAVFAAPSTVQLAAATVADTSEMAFIWSLSGVLAFINFLVWLGLGLVLMRMLFIIGLIIRAHIRKLPAHEYGVDQSRVPKAVSVIVPAYNEVENIEATLMSLINNRDITKEILVVNDGSTDDTAVVVDRFITQHPHENIRLISIPNGGKANALNTGIAASSHDFLVCMDGDTIFEPTTIRLLMEPFADPRVGAVGGKVYTTSLGSFLGRMQALEYMIGQNIDKRALGTVNGINVVPGPVGGWRKEAVIRAGGLPTETLAEDQDLTMTVSKLGYLIAYQPRALAYTETPPTVTSFLKQRFRWVYGTVQCFWKHKREMLYNTRTGLGGIALPNILIFSIVLPLTYPIMDVVLVTSLFTNSMQHLLLPALLFTGIDIAYSLWGTYREKDCLKIMVMVPFVRIVYRQLLYYIVIRAIVRAFEGGSEGWNKVARTGDSHKFYMASMAAQAATTPVAASGNQ